MTDVENVPVPSQQPTDYLMVGAEMEYAGFRWLYAVDLYRFPNGTDVLQDGFSVYTPDAHGRFTNQATHDDLGWRMPELKGLVLTGPGHELSNFMLQPVTGDSAAHHWTLDLAFKRAPAPIRR